MIVRIGYVHARAYFDSVVGLRLVNERKYIIVGVSLFLIFDEFRAKSRRSVLVWKEDAGSFMSVEGYGEDTIWFIP